MIQIECECIGEILLRQADQNPNHIALTFENEKLTYKQLLCKTASLQQKIKEKVESGDVVLICLPNSLLYIQAYFSITLLGAVVMPLYSASSKVEIVQAFYAANATLLITTTEMKSEFNDLDIAILYLEENQIHGIDIVPVYRPRNKNEVALMLQTSGTTGNPKIVQLTHYNLLTNIQAHCESLNLSKEDRVLITLPLPFGYCNTSQFLSHLYLGGQLVIMKGLFLPSSFMKIIRDQKITVVTTVPTMLQAISMLKSDYKQLPYLRYICFGGGQLTSKILEGVRRKLPQQVSMVQTYGQTEAGPRITTKVIQEVYYPANVGKPIRGVHIIIKNENDETLKPLEQGDIWISSLSVMKGYYKNELETSKVLLNGWLKTGDQGYLDEENNLWITGRKKSIIKTGGKQVHPEEIERLIMDHFPVEQVIVKGEADHFLGEILVAYIVPSHLNSVKENEILQFCRLQLSAYKVPKKVKIVSTLPKTPNGKIRRS
ncbi:hypothetical protein PaeCFBP13512_02885 [Paenibacillus sp. CFBP13512]|uniref:class I adenylate-forming enzyme family protein n=1 Tax=Paenibacillus sp. CFBP13512 TaxID=2184007 RepID=UPI0010C01242|nr:class I adenylate-forming enzyme family protein [Paenibacillus sp. CFBP13512]TKJ93360.1 hypothetical protein PaeCFBP13512_02885 [Paenibacillus sp. CFBP13512]